MTFASRWEQSRLHMRPLLDWFHREWCLHAALTGSAPDYWTETEPEADRAGVDLTSKNQRVGLRSRNEKSIPKRNGIPPKDVTFRVRGYDGSLESIDVLDWYCYGVFADDGTVVRAILFRVSSKLISAIRRYPVRRNRSGRNGFIAVPITVLEELDCVLSQKGWRP